MYIYFNNEKGVWNIHDAYVFWYKSCLWCEICSQSNCIDFKVHVLCFQQKMLKQKGNYGINIEKNGEKDIDTFVNVQHVPVYRIMTAE